MGEKRLLWRVKPYLLNLCISQQVNAPASGMFRFPRVARDGHVLPDASLPELFQDPSSYNSVPLITGTNRDEMKLFMLMNPKHVTRKGPFVQIPDQSTYNRIAAYHSDVWKATAVDHIARTIASHQHAPVWAYRFDWDNLNSTPFIDFPNALGAAHALELPFVFGEFEKGAVIPLIYNNENKLERLSLSKQMMEYWGNFARSGNPNGEGTGVQWQTWGENETEQFIIFDSQNDGGVRMSTDTTSVPQIKKRLQQDTSMNQQQQCQLHKVLFENSDFWGPCLETPE